MHPQKCMMHANPWVETAVHNKWGCQLILTLETIYVKQYEIAACIIDV